MRVHDLADADLAYLDAARQARARVAVEHGAVADALPARLEQRVLLGVDAEAGREGDAGAVAAVVAAGAAAVGAVAQAAGGAVVARADDAALAADEDAADAPLHAVGPLRREVGERHEVAVPTGAETVRVGYVELAECGVEVRQRGRRVEEAHRGPGYEGLQPPRGVVQVGVVLVYELLEAEEGRGRRRRR